MRKTRYGLDVRVRRGEILESRHRVHAAVVGADGRLLGTSRNAALATCWRSCAKPFQAMPLLRSGIFDRLGWSDDELALACASHGGEPEHVALAAAMLDALDLKEEDLACGAHEPLSVRGARLLLQAGTRPGRLHNNCSGKHAGMLALARGQRWPVPGYEQRGHQVQACGLQSVADWTRVPVGRIRKSVDGCGVVAFGLPLRAMAAAFARLGAASHRRDELAARIVGAMSSRPFLVGGTDRFDTVLMEETRGEVVCKVGAEGIHCLTLPGAGLGIAVKVEDGASRAQYVAVLRLLQHLGALPDPVPPRLTPFFRPSILNTRGELVGTLEPDA